MVPMLVSIRFIRLLPDTSMRVSFLLLCFHQL